MVDPTEHAQLLRELADELHQFDSANPYHDAAHLIARARQAAEEIEGREVATDAKIIAAVRHLYGDDKAAAMGAEDDLKTARAVLARFGGGEAGSTPPTTT